jgi:hypothetical protein
MGCPRAPAPPASRRWAQNGGPSTNGSAASDAETSLDTQMVSLACPDCSILLIEINPKFCERDLLEGVATASRLGASATSISLGGPEATDPHAAAAGLGGASNGTTGCPAEADWPNDLPGPFSTAGHLVFVSSADYGYNNQRLFFTPTISGAAPAYPASSPYVIAVGGTTLHASESSYGEGVWYSTTSGCSSEFAMPPWQAPVLAGSGCDGRAPADVAAAATFVSNGTEVGIEIVVHGQTRSVVGTSASAPLVAAMFTRLGLTTVASNDLSWIYKNRSAFNDVGSAEYPLPAGAPRTGIAWTVVFGLLLLTRRAKTMKLCILRSSLYFWMVLSACNEPPTRAPGACDRYADLLCEKAGPASAECRSIKTTAALLPPEACESGAKNVEYTTARLASVQKPCGDLAQRACAAIGPETETCKSITWEFKTYPAERCTALAERLPNIIAQLKQEQESRRDRRQ